MDLEKYFDEFRENIIGHDCIFNTCYGDKRLVYADWSASGRLYKPIEDIITNNLGPYVGNTHSNSSMVGKFMTELYAWSHEVIKNHVNGNENDIVLTTGTGMTGGIHKLQNILCVKNTVDLKDKPLVFITHMEHNSNYLPWLEMNCDLIILKPNKHNIVDTDELEMLLKKHEDRKIKIGSFTACSNISGIHTPYYKLATIMHKYNGLCFVDFSGSAPYDTINMHPANLDEKLDGVYFSPHKFLGGPGSSGVLVFDSSLYSNNIPDKPGGGTIHWVSPYKDRVYSRSIEIREDGGTPGFLQAIKAALAINLKDKMNPENIHKRDEEIVSLAFKEFKKIEGISLIEQDVTDRLPIISLYSNKIHYNLLTKMLNDYFGIQVRDGCMCAGMYAHYIFGIDFEKSKDIKRYIEMENFIKKPGWVRISLHPTVTNKEILYISYALGEVVKNYDSWKNDYFYVSSKNEYKNIKDTYGAHLYKDLLKL